jgi:hypothetical protein
MAIRLAALVDEDKAVYGFTYDRSDRPIEDKRIENLTHGFAHNLGGRLTRVNEIGYRGADRDRYHGEQCEKPINKLYG